VEHFAPWVAPATIAFAAAGALLVLWLTLRPRRGGEAPGARRSDGASQLACSVCQKEMVLHANGMAPLSGPERALIARNLPETVGKNIVEHICPYCESSHYFVVEGKRFAWLGANLYSPQVSTTHCMECRRPLRRPPWPQGAFDGHLHDAPALENEYGLVCERCKAVCCVECCTKATRRRTNNGTYHCPRCARPDVKVVFHP